jgi:uncharacterized protein (TIGR03118 family)
MLRRRAAAGCSAALMTMLAVALMAWPARADSIYGQTNLVSNIPGLASHTDPDLKNPWGISFSPTSPFWVADNGAGLSTLYNGAGVKQGLVVTIPPPPGSPAGTLATPTGTVFNGTADFMGDRFIFASEDGMITGWRPALGTAAAIEVLPTGGIYKGLATGSNASGNFLYATDFKGGKIDVFDATYGAATLSGNFTDPNLPAGYAPFGIENIGGSLYVTYAKVGAGGDDEAGAGNGFVDVFDTDGKFVRRFASQGVLNSPWGLALAPAHFAAFSNALLVGNFGDGMINAFDLLGNPLGHLSDLNGDAIVNEGLWALKFGNGGAKFDTNALYLTAGLNDEADGLFAKIEVTPEPASVVLFGTALAGFAALIRRRKNRLR